MLSTILLKAWVFFSLTCFCSWHYCVPCSGFDHFFSHSLEFWKLWASAYLLDIAQKQKDWILFLCLWAEILDFLGLKDCINCLWSAHNFLNFFTDCIFFADSGYCNSSFFLQIQESLTDCKLVWNGSTSCKCAFVSVCLWPYLDSFQLMIN
jgi:hypothetical protein